MTCSVLQYAFFALIYSPASIGALGGAASVKVDPTQISISIIQTFMVLRG